MMYNFDQIIDRTRTGSLKYDFAAQYHMPEGLIPLWVADMDFQAPKAVTEALVKAAEHGIFGYSDAMPEYFDAVSSWYRKNFNWEVKPEWLVKTPGIVFAIATAVKAFTAKGDGVMIQQPVYYPFSKCIQENGRRLVNSPLRYINGMYFMDLEDVEDKIIKEEVKLFLLCSPHNPVGRVWTKQELMKLGEICRKHDVILLSDEIHSDFVCDGYRHHVFSQAVPEMEDYSVICTAPSKTFNLAGLQVSNIFIANEQLREAFLKEMSRTGYSQVNQLGLVAARAAYEDGQEWLDQVRDYIKGNLEFVKNFVRERLPKLKVVEPEGTYLLWLDISGLGLSPEERDELMVGKAKLWLDKGDMFGEEGKNFERFNLACPRSILKQAMENLEAAVKSLS